jgi:hypothetical protein
MVVLQTTYTRLIYSTVLNPPDSCVREVTGTVNYMVMGWSVNYESIGFLIPMTLVILSALIVLIMAMINAKSGGSAFDPLKLGALLLLAAIHRDKQEEKEVPSHLNEWEHTVKFRTKVRDFQRMMGLIVEIVWPSQLLRNQTSKFTGEQLDNLKEEVGSVVSDTILG